MKKRIMSLLLVLVMFFSVLPIMPVRKSAAEETEETETLFDRYIPVNQAYSAKVSPFSVTEGVSRLIAASVWMKDST